MKRLTMALVALAAILALSTAAIAQEPLDIRVTVKGEVVKGSPGDHFLTFSGPVQLPEVTLPAGTYVFSLVTPSLVKVTSADRSQVYAMFFTVPTARADATEEYAMMFVRAGDTIPLRIATWYLPNQTLGHEFIYSSGEALGER